MRWQPPTPAGGWPIVDPPAEQPRDIERLRQQLADEREDAAILRRRTMEAPRAPAPASLSVSEVLRLYRERPEAAAEVKALIARQDLTEAQKMAEIQRVVRAR